MRFRYSADRQVEVFARSTDTARRVLFIDDMIPLRRLGSGFVRSNDLIQVMASLGYHVTVYPINPCRSGVAAIYADMPDTVEVMHDRSREQLADFLTARQGYYDTIWIARTHNLERVRPMLERLTAGTVKPPRIVLDTEAIVTLREAGHAALVDAAPFDVDAAIMQEFADAHLCQRHHRGEAGWRRRSCAISAFRMSWSSVIGAKRGRRRARSPTAPACCSLVRSISRTVRTAMRWSGSYARFCRWWNSRWAGRRG